MSRISLINYYIGMDLERTLEIFNPILIRLVPNEDNSHRQTKFRIVKHSDHKYTLNVTNIIYILEITSQGCINRLQNSCIDET